ncbi:MAG: hypothetical protein AB3X44_14590 [Leptothrix sp. (in: b-proteobacteria)]
MVMLETVAALAFVYALLSVVASAFKELLEAAVQRRKKDMRGALEDLLSPAGARQFLEHGLIDAVQNSSEAARSKDTHRRWPSYIEPATFAKVAVQMHQARQLVDCKLTRALDARASDAAEMARQIEELYTQRMERLGGSFKRNAQWWLLGLGLLCAVVMDADTMRLAQSLGQDPTRRATVVAMAQDAATLDSLKAGCAKSLNLADGTPLAPEQLLSCVDTAVPGVLGWSDAEWQRVDKLQGFQWIGALLLKLLGYLITAAAVSMGAPFWFDVINKVSNLRSTLKPMLAAAPVAQAPTAVSVSAPQMISVVPQVVAPPADQPVDPSVNGAAQP